MIEVDISNVWGDLALPDLLAMEKAVFDAHLKLTEETEEQPCPGWLHLPAQETVEEIIKAAETIRKQSEVCVVLGTGGYCLGARAVMEMLQGLDRNLGKGRNDPKLLFAGDSLSTRRWQELTGQLEDTDFSVIAVSGSAMAPETAIALRGLRWMLERKHGTDEANSRMYAVTEPEQGTLYQMARDAGWQVFSIPADVEAPFAALTAAGLLPMAVAGIDIGEVLQGALEAKENYDLRSYENPLWLYSAVRSLLYRSGKKIELFSSFEPGFRSFGAWWQQLFRGTAGGDGKGIFPAAVEYPADLHALGQGERNLFETMLRFGPAETEYVIGSHWKDLDGLNCLAGKTLDFVLEQAYYSTVEAHAEAGIPVITMDCGPWNARGAGELIYFLELSCGICTCVSEADSAG